MAQLDFENIDASLIPYDQKEIETVMKQLMHNNGITDVMYEGSNISQLTSIISYVISTLNVNTAINLQETILPLATKRMNVLMGARQLGYEPSELSSYKYNLTLKPLYDETKTMIDPNGKVVVDPLDTTDRAISIETNTKFTSGGKTYYYIGPRLENAIPAVSNYDVTHYNNPIGAIPPSKPVEDITINLDVMEGNIVTHFDDPQLRMTAVDYTENSTLKTKQEYIVPYRNLDQDDGLRVFLTYVDDLGNLVVDEEQNQTTEFLIEKPKTFTRMQNIILQYPSIFFEFAGFGNPIRSGTEIKVQCMVSSGSAGAATEAFKVDNIQLSTEIEAIGYTEVRSGSQAETDVSIKENAVIFHNTANRAVTRNDYIAISKRSSLVDEADAWGGEEEIPVQRGHIWVSATPEVKEREVRLFGKTYEVVVGEPMWANNPDSNFRNLKNWFLQDTEYDELFDYLDNYKIVSMQLHKRHPLHVNFDFYCDIIKYSMHQSINQTNKIVFDTINNYFKNSLENFETEYLNSNMQRLLDTALNYNTGINFGIKLTGSLNEFMIDEYYKNPIDCNTGLPDPGSARSLIIVNLSYPYEDIMQNGNLVHDYLPNIDTKNFGQTGEDLYVDMTAFVQTGDIFRSYLILGTTPVGEYIVDTKRNIIEIRFDFDILSIIDVFGPVTILPVTPPNPNLVEHRAYADFNISYYPHDEFSSNTDYSNTVNIPFNKNTIPRLRYVEFV